MTEITEMKIDSIKINKARKDNAKGVILIGITGIFMFFYVFIQKYNINILAVSVISLVICSLLVLNGILNLKLLNQLRIKKINKKVILILIAPTIVSFLLVIYFFN